MLTQNILSKLITTFYNIILLLFCSYFLDEENYQSFNLLYTAILIISAFFFTPLIKLKSRYYFIADMKNSIYFSDVSIISVIKSDARGFEATEFRIEFKFISLFTNYLCVLDGMIYKNFYTLSA